MKKLIITTGAIAMTSALGTGIAAASATHASPALRHVTFQVFGSPGSGEVSAATSGGSLGGNEMFESYPYFLRVGVQNNPYPRSFSMYATLDNPGREVCSMTLSGHGRPLTYRAGTVHARIVRDGFVAGTNILDSRAHGVCKIVVEYIGGRWHLVAHE